VTCSRAFGAVCDAPCTSDCARHAVCRPTLPGFRVRRRQMMEPSTRCSTGGPLPGDDGGDDGGDARGDVERRRRRRPATGQPVGRSAGQ